MIDKAETKLAQNEHGYLWERENMKVQLIKLNPLKYLRKLTSTRGILKLLRNT